MLSIAGLIDSFPHHASTRFDAILNWVALVFAVGAYWPGFSPSGGEAMGEVVFLLEAPHNNLDVE